MTEPRVYKFKTTQLIALVLLFGLLLAGAFFFISIGTYWFIILPFVAIFALIFIYVFFAMLKKTTITDDDISTQSLFGTKSLRWREINRVSGSGFSIKLHNADGDVTIAPSPQLPGYPELIEIIGAKRPDLFNPAEYSVLSRGAGSYFTFFFMTILYLTGCYFLLFSGEAPNNPIMVYGFVGFFGLAVFVFMFLTVLSIRLEGRTLTIRYLLSQTTLNADEIRSIGLNVVQSRNGKNYNIFIATGRRSIQFSGVGPGLPITLMVLRNWHRGTSANVTPPNPVDIASNWSSKP